jgi:hypothetical protein
LDVVARIKEHGPNHYSGLYNVMKGVTLAGGGLAFVRLAGRGFPLPHVALMTVALTGVFLTYYGQSVGLIIVHLRPSILDIALPMALTVVEFFIVYRPCAPARGDLPIDWFCALALWALLAASVIASVSWRIDRSNYSSALWPIAHDYRSELCRDVGAAGALAAVTTAFIAAHAKFTLGAPGEYVFLAVVFVVLAAGINSQGQTRRALAKRLAVPV